jgi:hypothetical protein
MLRRATHNVAKTSRKDPRHRNRNTASFGIRNCERLDVLVEYVGYFSQQINPLGCWKLRPRGAGRCKGRSIDCSLNL